MRPEIMKGTRTEHLVKDRNG